jgi:hypothetical protein
MRKCVGFYFQKQFNMIKKEIRQDVYTQKKYAELVGKTPAWVNQQIKAGNLKTLVVEGATLVKL